MNQLLCSTGALITRKNNRDYHLLTDIAPGLHCDGFEFMMYESWYDIWEQIVCDLSKMNLSFPLFHVEKCVGQAISHNEEGDNEQAQKLFENLKRLNYTETVTIESTSVLPDGSIDYDKLNGSLDYLRRLMT